MEFKKQYIALFSVGFLVLLFALVFFLDGGTASITGNVVASEYMGKIRGNAAIIIGILLTLSVACLGLRVFFRKYDT